MADKKTTSSHKSFIKLQVNFILEENEHFFKDSTDEYSKLLEILLSYELTESKVEPYWWDGKFTNIGEKILSNYCKNRNLSQGSVKLAQWITYCNIQKTHPLAFSLFNELLDSISIFIRNGTYTSQELKSFWKSALKIIDLSMYFLKQFRFDNERSGINLIIMLTKLKSIISMTQLGLLGSDMFDEQPINEIDKNARESLEMLVIDALKDNANKWCVFLIHSDEENGFQENELPLEKDSLCKRNLVRVGKVLQQLEQQLKIMTCSYSNPFKK